MAYRVKPEKLNDMVSESALLKEQYQERYLVVKNDSFWKVEVEDSVSFTDLKLSVVDSRTGRPISKAMISMDMLQRTAVCDDQGKILMSKVLSGTFIVDVIVPGYIANSIRIKLSSNKLNSLKVEMISNS